MNGCTVCVPNLFSFNSVKVEMGNHLGSLVSQLVTAGVETDRREKNSTTRVFVCVCAHVYFFCDEAKRLNTINFLLISVHHPFCKTLQFHTWKLKLYVLN